MDHRNQFEERVDPLQLEGPTGSSVLPFPHFSCVVADEGSGAKMTCSHELYCYVNAQRVVLSCH